MGLDEQIVKPIELRDPNSPTDIVQRPDLIIGNTITHGTASDMMVVPEDPVYARVNDMVYRNGYIVSVKGKRYEYDTTAQRYVAREIKKIYLKPIAVIPDGIKYDNDTYSDRVIFEGDFTDENGKAVFFNQLELQIYWQKSQFNENDQIKESQMAVIHDLIFSTERAIQSNEEAKITTQASYADQLTNVTSRLTNLEAASANYATASDITTLIDQISALSTRLTAIETSTTIPGDVTPGT
jgi:hypothetical protein